MQTLYVDVYFLINFTVDFIALYFATGLAKVPTSTVRLLIGSVIGAFFSVAYVLSPEIPIVKLVISCLGLLITVSSSIKRVSLVRKIKTVFSFLIFGALLGAAVYYIYGLMDKYLYSYLDGSRGSAENPKIIMFSLIVLLSIGVFKMLVSFFRNIESEGSGELEISVFGKTVRAEAFFDSGNLAIDPMDMRPILFIKEELAKRLLPKEVIELTDPDKLDRDIKKRIRLIPISRGTSTRVLTGIRADSVKLLRNNQAEELYVTLAIDNEGGNYGGFSALLPSSAINDGRK